MSDNAASSGSPVAAFSAAPGFDMLESMWRMMQLPGLSGTPSPSSMMSGMMAPLTNIEDLDKRITDMRAIEQWLKLNLNLLQSAIQALEVQRATLATLKAFGAFAQSSMEQAAAGVSETSNRFANTAESPAAAPPEPAESTASESAAPDPLAAIDPTPWWNLLQTQFNQIASLALAAQTQAAEPPVGGGKSATKSAAKSSTKSAEKSATKPPIKPASKRTAKPATKSAAARKAATTSTGTAKRAGPGLGRTPLQPATEVFGDITIKK